MSIPRLAICSQGDELNLAAYSVEKKDIICQVGVTFDRVFSGRRIGYVFSIGGNRGLV